MQQNQTPSNNSSIAFSPVECSLTDQQAVMALYLKGMHSHKAKELACLLSNPFASENSASVGCTCMQAETNLDHYVSVIYDV